MKKNLLKGMMSMAFAMFAMGAFAQETPTVLTASGDTWVRSNSPTNTWGSTTTLEMKTDATNGQNFYGLMTFAIPAAEDGMEVKSATLRLVTNYKKGDNKMKIYPLTTAVTNKTTYNDVEKEITSALTGDAIAEFAMKGDGVQSVAKNPIGADFLSIEAWTNMVDVTSAVKALAGENFSFFIAKALDQAGKSNQIFSSRATDVTNTAVTPNITFAAADLVPQLTIVYEKSSTNGVSEVKTDANASSDAIYNLQGVRMNSNNLPAGIYVKNGKKFIVK